MPQIQKGTTYSSSAPNNQVTHTNLNAHVDDATLLAGAITEQADLTTTDVADAALVHDESAGSLKKVTLNNLLPDGTVTAAKLATDAVTTDKLINDAVQTAKIEDTAVTAAKLTQQAQGGVHQYAPGVYGAGVYAITLSPARTAYTAGMVIRFKADTANTGAVDVNVNGLPVRNLYKNVGSEVEAGDIPINAVVEAVYDGTNFQITGISHDGFGRYMSSNQALPGAGSAVTLAHGLGSLPRSVRWVMVCTTSNLGYAIGDEVEVHAFEDSGVHRPGFSPGADATNVFIVQANASIQVMNKSDGSYGTNITAGSWRLKVYAQR